METTLIYHHGLELPDFAAFTVLASDGGEPRSRRYYDAYLTVAEIRGASDRARHAYLARELATGARVSATPASSSQP